MPSIKYVGPSDAVEIPALGIIAELGVPIDVDEGAAIALTAQSVWELAETPKKPKSADTPKES